MAVCRGETGSDACYGRWVEQVNWEGLLCWGNVGLCIGGGAVWDLDFVGIGTG